MPRRPQTKISRKYTTATVVTKRIVNTYSRFRPRQTIDKHHFLTPDTPYSTKYELPSHMLLSCSDTVSPLDVATNKGETTPSEVARSMNPPAESVSTTGGAESGETEGSNMETKQPGTRKIRRQSRKNSKGHPGSAKHLERTAAPYCNLDTVSMELTCKTNTKDSPGCSDVAEFEGVTRAEDKVRKFHEFASSKINEFRCYSQSEKNTSYNDIKLVSMDGSDGQISVSQPTSSTPHSASPKRSPRRESQEIDTGNNKLQNSEGTARSDSRPKTQDTAPPLIVSSAGTSLSRLRKTRQRKWPVNKRKKQPKQNQLTTDSSHQMKATNRGYSSTIQDLQKENSSQGSDIKVPKASENSGNESGRQEYSDVELPRARDDITMAGELESYRYEEMRPFRHHLKQPLTGSDEEGPGIFKSLQSCDADSLHAKPAIISKKQRGQATWVNWETCKKAGGYVSTCVATDEKGDVENQTNANGLDGYFRVALKNMTPIVGVASLSPLPSPMSQHEGTDKLPSVEKTPELIMATTRGLSQGSVTQPKTSTPMQPSPVPDNPTKNSVSTNELKESENSPEAVQTAETVDEVEEPTPHKRHKQNEGNGSFGFNSLFDKSQSPPCTADAAGRVSLGGSTAQLRTDSVPEVTSITQSVRQKDCEFRPPSTKARKTKSHVNKSHPSRSIARKKPGNISRMRRSNNKKSESNRRLRLPYEYHTWRWNKTLGSTYTRSTNSSTIVEALPSDEEKDYPVCILARLSQQAGAPPSPPVYGAMLYNQDTAPVDVLLT